MDAPGAPARPHNVAREGFVREMLDHLAGGLARTLGMELDHESREDLVAELRDSRDVRRELNLPGCR